MIFCSCFSSSFHFIRWLFFLLLFTFYFIPLRSFSFSLSLDDHRAIFIVGCCWVWTERNWIYCLSRCTYTASKMKEKNITEIHRFPIDSNSVITFYVYSYYLNDSYVCLVMFTVVLFECFIWCSFLSVLFFFFFSFFVIHFGMKKEKTNKNNVFYFLHLLLFSSIPLFLYIFSVRFFLRFIFRLSIYFVFLRVCVCMWCVCWFKMLMPDCFYVIHYYEVALVTIVAKNSIFFLFDSLSFCMSDRGETEKKTHTNRIKSKSFLFFASITFLDLIRYWLIETKW